jgi:hypothetical protein
LREKHLNGVCAFSQNNNALRSQGQLGSSLYEARTLKSVFFDAILKYNGWSATGAYMSRMADIQQQVQQTQLNNRQFCRNGIDAQLAYLSLQIIK